MGELQAIDDNVGEAEETRHVAATLHPLLAAVFTALEQAPVRWCLLRFPSHPAAPTGDVDLLIDQSDLRRAWKILESLDFAALPGVGSGTEYMFFCYNAETDRWLKLHVVTQLGFGLDYELRSDAEAGCLDRRRRNGYLAGLAPGDEFWVTLLHCLLDKGTVAKRYRAGLQDLLNATSRENPLAQVVLKACPAQWSPSRLMECVAQNDWDALERLAPNLGATWKQRSSLGSRLGNRLRHGLLLPVKLRQAWRRRGLSMAVLGPDGAGKSTLAEGVQKSFCRPVQTIYMGFGGQGTPPLLTRLRLPGLGAPGHLLVLWWQYLKAQYHRLRGCLVIFDRYTYDTLAPAPRQQGWISRVGSWVKAHACPAPHLVIILNAPGPMMFERKGELNAQVLEAQRQRYLALRERIAQSHVVDATRSQDAVRIEVLTHLWKLYQSHWR